MLQAVPGTVRRTERERSGGVESTTRLAGRPSPPDYHHLNSSSIVISSVDEKLDATETGYGSIKDEPKTGGGLKLIVVGMLIGAIFGVLGTMALMTPHSPLAQFSEDDCCNWCTCMPVYADVDELV